MNYPQTDDDPWRPGWDPRRLATLTRPDPRYYRHVPDLSGYFVVAHYQTPDWRPGEGDPGSIRWLREEAPELIVDGRLRVGREDAGAVATGTRSCVAGGGATEARLRAQQQQQQQQKSPSSAPPVARPFGGRPVGWSGGEPSAGSQQQQEIREGGALQSACDQTCGRARQDQQHGIQDWHAREKKSHPTLQQRKQSSQDRGFDDQQPKYQRDTRPASGKGHAPLQHEQRRPATEMPANANSSGDQSRSWVWPDTSEVASGQQPDPRHLRINQNTLEEIHRLSIGHPQSPWGWPENSDESGMTRATDEESVGTREARRRHNAKIEKRATHPQRYIRPSSPSTDKQGPRGNMEDGSTSSSNSSGFAMQMPQWPGAQERYTGSRDSPSYLHGTRRASDESEPYANKNGAGYMSSQSRENYVYGGFEQEGAGFGAEQGPHQENRPATRQVGQDDEQQDDAYSVPRAAWDSHYRPRRREPVPFQPSAGNQQPMESSSSGSSVPPSRRPPQRNEPSSDCWSTNDQRRRQPPTQQRQQPHRQWYPQSDW